MQQYLTFVHAQRNTLVEIAYFVHDKYYTNNVMLLNWYNSWVPLLLPLFSLVLLTDIYTAEKKMTYIPDSHYVVTILCILCLVSRMQI